MVDNRYPFSSVLQFQKPFTREEVHRSLHDMKPSTTMGPDGFFLSFYLNFWHMIGDWVTDDVLAVLNDGADMTAWNETIISLIPKVKDRRPFKNINQLVYAMSVTSLLPMQI